MAPYPITLDGKDLNDGVNYFVLGEGLNFGQPQTTWDEAVSYSGANAQVNVHVKQALITMPIPMMVKATSVGTLHTKLDELWAKVDAATYDTPLHLVVGSITYDIVYSTRPSDLFRNNDYQMGYWCKFTLELTRLP